MTPNSFALFSGYINRHMSAAGFSTNQPKRKTLLQPNFVTSSKSMLFFRGTANAYGKFITIKVPRDSPRSLWPRKYC